MLWNFITHNFIIYTFSVDYEKYQLPQLLDAVIRDSWLPFSRLIRNPFVTCETSFDSIFQCSTITRKHQFTTICTLICYWVWQCKHLQVNLYLFPLNLKTVISFKTSYEIYFEEKNREQIQDVMSILIFSFQGHLHN